LENFNDSSAAKKKRRLKDEKKREGNYRVTHKIQKDFCKTIASTGGEEGERKQKAGKNRRNRVAGHNFSHCPLP